MSCPLYKIKKNIINEQSQLLQGIKNINTECDINAT